MRIAPRGINSIAYYGSAVRGDLDGLSDRDILIVSDDEAALGDAKQTLSKEGYSCACYDWNKLTLLASKQALFIQHLKQESRIVLDNDGRLRSLLARYSPATDYSMQINAARHLVSLSECFPDTSLGIGWALDVLAIGFRNLAILSLANEGKYVFSFSALVSSLRNSGLIDRDSARALLNLRKYKSAFRRKRLQALPPKENVFEIQEIIGEVFDVGLRPKVISEESFHDYCLNSRRAIPTGDWYMKARLYEGAFLTLDRGSKHIDVDMLSRFQAVEDAIANPACYSMLFSNSADNLRTEVIELSKAVGLKAA